MNRTRFFKQYRGLILALGTILVTTLVLAVMQYVSVRRAERQGRATFEANLDMHLLSLVGEARRDMIDRAGYITHSISHARIRQRDIEGLARSYTRALRRYPEMRTLYAILFDGRREQETWRVLRFVPPAATDPTTPKYKGVAVGSFVEETNTSEALRQAWLTIPDRTQDATYWAYTPVSLNDATPRQLFFHPVYEPDHMDRESELDRIGLIAFSADVESYPTPDYLNTLIARHEQRAASESLGDLTYSVRLSDDPTTHDRIATNSKTKPLRERGFERGERLFPTLTFGIAPRDLNAAAYLNEYTTSSLLLGLGAAGLSLIGLGLTWRATRREMSVAQIKSDFLASVSHELKTPLTAIRAFGDLLRSGRARDPSRIREYGEMITTESDRLTALINNILEMSRLERGIRRYRLETGLLCATVERAVELFRHTAAAHDFSIELALPSLPIETKFDESAINQVMLNLLSNAVKYSGAPGSSSTGRQRIEVRVMHERTEAVIEVRDYGIGIAPSEQRNIFNLFHRAPQAEVQTRRGTGLGLAIVREIAKAHGGDVSVESAQGAGATFRVRLPLLLPEQESGLSKAEGKADDEYFSNRRRTERSHRLAR